MVKMSWILIQQEMTEVAGVTTKDVPCSSHINTQLLTGRMPLGRPTSSMKADGHQYHDMSTLGE